MVSLLRALLFCGVSLVEWVADAFNVSYDYASTYVVNESTYPYCYFIFSFASKFELSSVLIIAAVR